VLHGDCLAVLPTLEAESVDAVVCDPPYGLSFMGKNWDHGIPGVAFWVEALRVAKPGAHLVAFGGTRTFHRLACAIEDAGWEIRDTLSWLYGSGFPKSLDVSKALDKAAGVEGKWSAHPTYANRNGNGADSLYGQNAGQAQERALYSAATDAAKQWAGWGTALKPAHEPIIVAQKPYTQQQLLAILAPTTKGELCRVGSYAKTGTPLYGWLHASGFWSIGGSLSNTLDALSDHASRFTTETASALITDLRILKSSLSRITPDTITEAASPTSGAESSVWLAASISRSVLAKCGRLESTTADELAISSRADEENDQAGSKRPAYEPIILARKPLVGTVARTVSEYGTGALNIDGCRIGHASAEDLAASQAKNPGRSDLVTSGVYGEGRPQQRVNADGRWPANVVLSHSPECRQVGTRKVKGSHHAGKPVTGGKLGKFGIYGEADGAEPSPFYADAGGTETVPHWDCAPDCAVRLLDEQSGELRARGNVNPTKRQQSNGTWGANGFVYGVSPDGPVQPGDTGGASRFFYTAKASRREREAGLEGMPRQTNARSNGAKAALARGDETAHDAFNSHVRAANTHPTVKPLALMRWLCRLVTPPGGVILDPFTGSGTTGCATVLEGFRFVGIEQEAEYVEIARRRIAHWATQRPQPDTQTELEVA
jgi:hypothetical protein